jgi:hypothetical protein
MSSQVGNVEQLFNLLKASEKTIKFAVSHIEDGEYLFGTSIIHNTLHQLEKYCMVDPSIEWENKRNELINTARRVLTEIK